MPHHDKTPMSLRQRIGRLYGDIRGGATTFAVTARFRAALNRRGAAAMFSGTPCSRQRPEEDCATGSGSSGAAPPHGPR